MDGKSSWQTKSGERRGETTVKLQTGGSSLFILPSPPLPVFGDEIETFFLKIQWRNERKKSLASKMLANQCLSLPSFHMQL